jgi:hypothetical protein
MPTTSSSTARKPSRVDEPPTSSTVESPQGDAYVAWIQLTPARWSGTVVVVAGEVVVVVVGAAVVAVIAVDVVTAVAVLTAVVDVVVVVDVDTPADADAVATTTETMAAATETNDLALTRQRGYRCRPRRGRHPAVLLTPR